MYEYINGLVSVIMPTYKRSEKLIRAIKSVLSQTYSNLELLLVNDNDPGDLFTLDLQQKVNVFEKDPRFHLIIQEKHVNGAVARNIGIRHARGEFIAFLDDDDWWKEDKIEKQIKVLYKLSEEYGVVSCRIEHYNNEKLIARLPKYRDGYVYKDILMLKSDFATSTLLFRHKLLDEVGYFDEKLLRHQDLQLLTIFTYKYKLKQINEFLHCCDISDIQNRPNVEKIIKTKKMYFESISQIFETLDRKEKNAVICAHRCEVGITQLKNRKIFEGVKNCIPIIFHPTIFLTMLKKLFNHL